MHIYCFRFQVFTSWWDSVLWIHCERFLQTSFLQVWITHLCFRFSPFYSHCPCYSHCYYSLLSQGFHRFSCNIHKANCISQEVSQSCTPFCSTDLHVSPELSVIVIIKYIVCTWIKEENVTSLPSDEITIVIFLGKDFKMNCLDSVISIVPL